MCWVLFLLRGAFVEKLNLCNNQIINIKLLFLFIYSASRHVIYYESMVVVQAAVVQWSTLMFHLAGPGLSGTFCVDVSPVAAQVLPTVQRHARQVNC